MEHSLTSGLWYGLTATYWTVEPSDFQSIWYEYRIKDDSIAYAPGNYSIQCVSCPTSFAYLCVSPQYLSRVSGGSLQQATSRRIHLGVSNLPAGLYLVDIWIRMKRYNSDHGPNIFGAT
ncbi:hypothetical protein FVEG_16202 [Fusarium verticillioides 7600]|uniref:Uncharacterized protein n=1 Tax=Gibberella moniliformis (strain M3125 / FGSC 7600) TaxID=334819 RepID=W7MU53_GIBM7|nr:hypothetical protein FVEG_16202 [Fusarium verticillioides 7600]EWG47887.1 hypothetical protein FVEG_16202 [Fusarium verticillioides 7600]